MPICKYRECREQFVPNPRNRTGNVQEFCSGTCRTKQWMLDHPRMMARDMDAKREREPNDPHPTGELAKEVEVRSELQEDADELLEKRLRARRVYENIKRTLAELEQQYIAGEKRMFECALRRMKDLIRYWNFDPQNTESSAISDYEYPGIEAKGAPGHRARRRRTRKETSGLVVEPTVRTAPSRFVHRDRRGRRSPIRPDLDLTALAKTVGVGPGYVSKLFRGIGTPSVSLAEKLASAMQIPLEQLLHELDEQRAMSEEKK
jgi:transcriptional regulator with XRE-family HTH domain